MRNLLVASHIVSQLTAKGVTPALLTLMCRPKNGTDRGEHLVPAQDGHSRKLT
jgi:hypothetical protein